jgi:hypothetical protein
MIQPNELRIGNWVRRRGTYHQVFIIDTTASITTNAEPIPLTEEILLKCGVDDEMLAPEDRGEFRSIGSFVLVKNSCDIYHYLMANTELKYVHELQNLYYAIYKQELNIEL